jgi:hypothetical protein
MGDLVFLYDNKFLQHPRKFQMHWLGPYVIIFVIEAGVVQLEKLNGEIMEGLVNKVGLNYIGTTVLLCNSLSVQYIYYSICTILKKKEFEETRGLKF